jgi:hypothetical protein
MIGSLSLHHPNCIIAQRNVTLLDCGNKLANQTIHARRVDAQPLIFQNNAMQRSTKLGWLDLAHTV